MARGVFLKKNEEKYYPAPYMPIGSIYITVSNDNPSKWFGGTWEQIKDQFLLSAGDTYKAGTTGGSATHTLTVDEIPAHTHKIKRNNNYTGSFMIDIGKSNQWGSAITNTSGYTAQPIGVTIENTGGGAAHNNMPPYLAVYVWKRVS